MFINKLFSKIIHRVFSKGNIKVNQKMAGGDNCHQSQIAVIKPHIKTKENDK